MVKFSGHPESVIFWQFYQNIDVWRFTRLLEFIKLYKQNPLENFFIFTIYQKLYIGFNNDFVDNKKES